MSVGPNLIRLEHSIGLIMHTCEGAQVIAETEWIISVAAELHYTDQLSLIISVQVSDFADLLRQKQMRDLDEQVSLHIPLQY